MATVSQAWVFSASNSTIFLLGDNALTPLSLGGNVAVGDLIVIEYTTQNNSRSITGIADSAGTTYVAAGSLQAGDAGRVHIWYGIAASVTAGQSIVVTLSGGNGEKAQIGASAFNGTASDQSSRTSNGGVSSNVTAHNSGSVTPPNAGAIVAIATRTNGTYTEDANITEAATGDDNFYVGHRLDFASAEELNFTSTDNEFAAMAIVAFAGATGASTAHIPTYLQMLRSNQ